MNGEIQLTETQRAAAIDRAGENVALRSGAGCGKTLVLARRYAELLLRAEPADSPLARLVALTFTDKAALEMSQRVAGMLRHFASQAKGPGRRRLLDWLQQLPEARISTIHSFCASLLRSHAIEAGVDPNFTVCADELLAQQILEQAADEAVLQAVEARQEEVARLLGDLPYARAVQHVQWLVDQRGPCNCPDYLDPAATMSRWQTLIGAQRERAWRELASNEALARELDQIAAVPCSDPSDKLARYRDEQLAVMGQIRSSFAAMTAETFERLDAAPGGIGTSAAWGGKGPVKAARDRVKAAVSAVKQYAIYAERLGEQDRQAAAALATLARLALRAEGLYATEKRRRGLLDFTDLLTCTHKLLVDRPDVRRALGEQIEQLLVDETQDTDRLQLALLERLLFGAEQGEQLPDGRLFLVGDAKQSIYRFRGAQVEVFEDLCRRLGPAKQEYLARSFRTHAAGVAFVNHLFAPMMGAGYVPMDAHRSELPAHPSVEILLAEGSEDAPISDAASASQAQAAATAERIRQMLDRQERLVRDAGRKAWRPVRPGDIAVLFARMTNSLAYERELALREVPYYVIAGTGFFQQQEVFDVLNAMRVIDNPFDDVALFGVLRSSLFGLDDNALMHIAERCDPPYWPGLGAADVAALLDASQQQTLAFALELLGALHRQKDAASIDRLVQRLLDETGYEAVLLAQFQGRRMVGNVRILLDRARAASAESMSLAEFIAQMAHLIVRESRYEQAAVSHEAEDVVRIMTIHKAKGLEFPVVFVPDLNAGRRGWTGDLLNRLDWGVTYGLRADETSADDGEGRGELPLSSRLAKVLEDRDQQAEDIRKLYVAATRHRDHLVFVGANLRTTNGTFRPSGSYLQQMDEVLGITAAVDAGRDEIAYGDGNYVAAVRRVAPGKAASGTPAGPPGQVLLASADSATDLAVRIEKAAEPAAAPLLVGPLGADVGKAELAVTALSEFEYCPMLYYWRYELRVPKADLQGDVHASEAGGDRPASAGPGSIDAATLGTLYHRCMELLDFSSPQEPGQLVIQAAGEAGLPEAIDTSQLADELAGMLKQMRSHELWPALAGAREIYRELDFAMDIEPAMLRGQIDLLYQDAAGAWRILDYKSDHISAEQVDRHAGRYELQMLAYATAAARHLGALGEKVQDAVLYFLRPAVAHTLTITPRKLKDLQQRVPQLARALITSRRTGQFKRAEGSACPICPYRYLCRRNG